MITQQTWAIVVLAMLLIALSLQGVAVGTSSWFTATCSGHAATLGLWEYCEKPLSLDWSCMPINTALNGTELPHWLWAAQLHECLGVGALTLTSLVLGAYILIPELIEPSVAIAFSMLAIASGTFTFIGLMLLTSGHPTMTTEMVLPSCNTIKNVHVRYCMALEVASIVWIAVTSVISYFAFENIQRTSRTEREAKTRQQHERKGKRKPPGALKAVRPRHSNLAYDSDTSEAKSEPHALIQLAYVRTR